jgi:CBS domain-containing protein
MNGNQSVAEAVECMKENNLSYTSVSLPGHKRGIVTERNFVFKVIGKCMDPKTTLLKEVATVDPITITDDSSLERALKIMRDKNLRRLIVVDGRGSPVGVLDQGYFLQSL